MNVNNQLLPLENYPQISNIVQGIPVTSEIEPHINNISQDHFELHEVLPVQVVNVAQSVKHQLNPEEQMEKFLSLMCKYSSLYYIHTILCGGQFFVEGYMLGHPAALIILGIAYSEQFFVFAVHFCAGLKSSALCINFAEIILVIFLFLALAVFFVNACVPVRYTFDNPEAFNLVSAHKHFYSEQVKDYVEDEQSVPSESYYLYDICQDLFRNSSQGLLEQSSIDYCQKLLSGATKEHNLQNLHPVQIGLYLFFY